MPGRTPTVKKLAVNIAPGSSRTFKYEDFGVQRAIFLPKGIMEQNPTLFFGETSDGFQFNTNTGLFIDFAEEFDSLKIEVPAAAAGNASGTILLSAACGFLIQSV